MNGVARKSTSHFVTGRSHGISFATTRKYVFLPCGHIDFESAVTAQNHGFKAVFMARIHVFWMSKLSLDTFGYVR